MWNRFRKKLAADDQIKSLETQKEEILETVMEKEPYNKAREILKQYAPGKIFGEKKTTNAQVSVKC